MVSEREEAEMADPIDQSGHGSYGSSEEQPLVVVQPFTKKKGVRGKSREPSRASSELEDLKMRMAKVELKLIDGEEKFEEIDLHLETCCGC